MIAQYADNCGNSALSQEIIDELVQGLWDYDLKLTQEKTFKEFLGIKFKLHKDKSVKCTQRGLIKKVLTAAQMKDHNRNLTPALQTPLGTDKDREPMTNC